MPPIHRVKQQVDKRGTQVSQVMTSMALSRMSGSGSWCLSSLNWAWAPSSQADFSWLVMRSPILVLESGKRFRDMTLGLYVLRVIAQIQDEMVRYHHQLNGRESEQTLGDSEG